MERHHTKASTARRQLVREKIREVVGCRPHFINKQVYGYSDKYLFWDAEIAKKVEKVIKKNHFEAFVDVGRSPGGPHWLVGGMLIHIRNAGQEFGKEKK